MTGENAIILDMDETRELRWTFGAIKLFEKRAKDIIKRLDLRNERGQTIHSIPVHAGYVLANFMKIADIMEAAVAAAAGISGLDGPKGTPSEASVAIQGYLDRGGSMDALQREIYRAYLVTNDPSSMAEYEANLAREAEINRINKEKQEAKLEIARLELANDQKKIETLKKISGKKPTDSPT